MSAMLFSAFLVVLMPAGFGLVATGLVRAKNAAHTMAMHLLCFGAVAGFFACGFAFLGDGPVTKLSQNWNFHHSRGYFLAGDQLKPDRLAWFLLTAGYACVTAVIPTGALAERWKLKSFFLFLLAVGAIIFPVSACWFWTGGWLAQLGTKGHLGGGAIDYAGSCSIHLLGGTLALVATRFLRPRIGKYDEYGKPRPVLGHNVPMVMLGTLILFFAWFGFVTGHSFATHDGREALASANTLLAGAGGAIGAALYVGSMYGKPDPSLTCNGILAGLVAACAPCGLIAPWAAFLIGLVGGVVAVWGVLFCERRRIDDPVGAASVHGLGGLWGTLAVGLFADGTFVSASGGAAPIRGLFYGGGWGQLGCQLIAAAAVVAWAAATGGLFFFAVDRFLGGNRVPPEVEIAGLDIPEMGAPGYPEFISSMAPEQFAAAKFM